MAESYGARAPRCENEPMPCALAALGLVLLAGQAGGGQTDHIEVIFSVPGQDEGGVGLGVPIRLQFSGNLDAASLEGRVVLSYAAEESRERGEPEPPAIGFTLRYEPGDRALTIQPAEPWARFREVRLQLVEGIRAGDGRPLKPYRLSFVTGGS